MQERLLILDGHNLAYRCFYAMAHWAEGEGTPTHALHGFVRSLRALERIRAPTHHAVVFDGGRDGERLRAFPEYKANRPPMPGPLRIQLPLIERYLGEAAVPAVRIEGVEADDAMATLAARAARDGAQVEMATSDKDLYQMIGERIRVVPLARPRDAEDEQATIRRFGVPPGRLADSLALAGDASDNLPGVPGVGPVTAARLASRFDSLEALYEGLDRVAPGRLRAALSAHRDRVRRNRELIGLRTDVAGLPDWRELAVLPVPEERVAAFFRSLGLPSRPPPPRQPGLFD